MVRIGFTPLAHGVATWFSSKSTVRVPVADLRSQAR
jgi:hypothetical protein